TVNDYNVFFYYSEIDNCYLARIPDLAGCISDGETPEEAVRNVRELGREWLEIAFEDGTEIPVPTGKAPASNDRPSVFDIAVYILDKTGSITTKALQKLCYYCKAWSCVYWSKPIFPEGFEAWTGGPINRDLWDHHSRLRMAKKDLFKPYATHQLDANMKQFVDSVLFVYEDFEADELGDLTHFEEPWKQTRGNLPSDASCTDVISDELMRSYYGKAI
ncbi:MAG: DUF4065 domain-containing protein, partial [Lachnospiraceae bacterium]|nr:DUF4065 domain-containing protein [Lachnospiraceae bacterium]